MDPRAHHWISQFTGADQPKFSLRALRWLCLAGLLGLCLLAGAVEPVVSEDSHGGQVLALLVGLLAVGLVVLWCEFDAAERRLRIGLGWRLLIIGFAMIGVPCYLVRTRGVYGLLSIVLATLFVILCALVAWCGEQVVRVVAGL